MAIEDALALHLGGVRGEHRLHGGAVEEGRNFTHGNLGLAQTLEGKGQAAFPGAAGIVACGRLPVAAIFSDVGQLVEVAECADDVLGLRLIERGNGAL